MNIFNSLSSFTLRFFELNPFESKINSFESKINSFERRINSGSGCELLKNIYIRLFLHFSSN